MRKLALLTTLSLVALIAVVAATMSFAASSRNDDLTLAKKATAKYTDVSAAFADGFTPVGPCVSDPGGTGNMGIHFDHPTRLRDLVVDPESPDILLYERKRDGSLRLVGLEYWMAALANTPSGPVPWFGPTPPPGGFFNPAPTLFGQTFDGPMPGHSPVMPWHYDLHVWLYKWNPNGMFAMFNPKAHCD